MLCIKFEWIWSCFKTDIDVTTLLFCSDSSGSTVRFQLFVPTQWHKCFQINKSILLIDCTGISTLNWQFETEISVTHHWLWRRSAQEHRCNNSGVIYNDYALINYNETRLPSEICTGDVIIKKLCKKERWMRFTNPLYKFFIFT